MKVGRNKEFRTGGENAFVVSSLAPHGFRRARNVCIESAENSCPFLKCKQINAFLCCLLVFNLLPILMEAFELPSDRMTRNWKLKTSSGGFFTSIVYYAVNEPSRQACFLGCSLVNSDEGFVSVYFEVHLQGWPELMM